MRYLSIVLPSLKLLTVQILAFFTKAKYEKKRIWLVGEKKREARDNGYHVFKYLNDEHPEIESYYAIQKSSTDYAKVESLGKIVEYNSWKHCLLYFVSEVRACSQVHGVRPYEEYSGLSRLFFFKRKGQKHIHLKHGIAKDLLSVYDFRKYGYDLLICGARPEYDYYKKQYNYPDDKIALTGLCRYDALNDFKCKNILLIMPTFREWLRTSDSSKDMVTEVELARFKGSDYYINYCRLLKDINESSLLEGDMHAVFYLHYTLQPYRIAFVDCGTNNIIIASRNEYDVQQLLKDAKALVTDYSSVYSDFAYMGKPVVYFQFDEEKYRKEHYQQGYFDYHRDGFGPVLYKTNDVVEYLNMLKESEYSMETLYKNRLKNYFPYRDGRNCERVFNSIKNIIKDN